MQRSYQSKIFNERVLSITKCVVHGVNRCRPLMNNVCLHLILQRHKNNTCEGNSPRVTLVYRPLMNNPPSGTLQNFSLQKPQPETGAHRKVGPEIHYTLTPKKKKSEK
jgi:hypothetical protein